VYAARNAGSSVKGDSHIDARDAPEGPKPRHFSEPEIDHFVMAITSAEARVWHIPPREVERPHVAAGWMGGL
jgi:hypothetical protein